jgi:hypothetical protein
MSTKAIYEGTGKKLLNKYLGSTAAECRCVNVDADTDWTKLIENNRWLESEVLIIIKKFEFITNNSFYF